MTTQITIHDLQAVIHYPSCFCFYYLVLLFSPKPNSKLPFVKWLSPSPRTVSSTLQGTVWPLLTSDFSVSLTFCMVSGFIRWKSFLVVILTAACDCNRPHWTSLCCVKMSALNLNLLLRWNTFTAPQSNQKYARCLPLPPHFFFKSSPLSSIPAYVAVQYLCIYICRYLMIIIYCIRSRFALLEDEFQ